MKSIYHRPFWKNPDFWLNGWPIWLCLFILHYPTLLHLNSYMLDPGADSIRAYYSYAWYIQYNDAWFNFEGINHPFGENIFYLDCNPLLCFIMRPLVHLFPGLAAYSVAILNLTVFVNVWICYYVIRRIFRFLETPPYAASIAALFITLLSPQFIKSMGNFSLAFTQLVPLILLFWLQIHTQPKKILPFVYLGLTVLGAFLVHPYLGLIAALFAGGLLAGTWLFRLKTVWKYGWYYLGVIAATGIPVLVFFLLMKKTDWHPGRTGQPWGFGRFLLPWDELVIPPFGAFRELLKSVIAVTERDTFDHAFFAWPLLVLLLLSGIFYVMHRKSVAPVFRSWFIPLLVSLAGLAIAMGFWGLVNFDEIGAKYPVIKHFRYTTRFAWPLYYVASIGAVYIFIQHLCKTRYRKIWISVAFILCVGAAWETESLHRVLQAKYQEQPNFLQLSTTFTDIEKLVQDVPEPEGTAILPIPFFNVGSNNFQSRSTYYTLKSTYAYAYFTGKPIAAAMIIRTSEDENRMLMQQVTDAWYPKYIAEFENPENIYLILEEKNEASANEKPVLARSTLRWSGDTTRLYSLALKDLYKDGRKDFMDAVAAFPGTVVLDTHFRANDSIFFYRNTFGEKYEGDYTRIWPGALVGPKSIYHQLAWIPPGSLEKDSVYIASFWICNALEDAVSGWVVMQEQDSAGTEIVSLADVNPLNSQHIDGNWTLAELEFTVKNPGRVHALYFKGPDYASQRVALDEVWVYPKGDTIVSVWPQKDGSVWYARNNHWVISGKEEK